MESAWRERPADSRNRFPSVVTADSLASFYSDSSTSILVSAYWHSLRPDRYALHGVAALQAIQMYASGGRVFEVGHGIGSTALLLTQNHLDVTIGDVSDGYIAFARSRFGERNLRATSLDLRDSYPAPRSQDAVVCLDVLEHVLDPLALVEQMADALDDGGLLVLNIAFGVDPNTPEHILPKRLGFTDRLRDLQLEPLPHPTLTLLWKRSLPRWERPVRRVQDVLAAINLDARARFPRVQRALGRSASPPIGRGLDSV